MKRFFFSLITVVGGTFLSMLPAMAKYYGLTETGGAANFSGESDIFVLIAKIVSVFLGTLAFVFFGFTVYAGLRWMTAKGNAEFVDKAKNSMESAIIGLGIILSAYALVRFVLTRLGAA